MVYSKVSCSGVILEEEEGDLIVIQGEVMVFDLVGIFFLI